MVHQQNSLTCIKAVVGEFKPSIIIMDVEVGAEDGIDVMPEVYTIAPEIPIIVISSHSESNEVVRALQNGAVAYLKKPFETEELAAYIKRHANVTHNSILSIYNLIGKLRKVLSVDARIELVTVGKDGYALRIGDVASCT